MAFFSASQYSFDTHKSKAWWSLLDLKTGESTTLTEDENVSEIVWLDDSAILYLNSTNADTPGGVELWVSDTNNFAKGYVRPILFARHPG